MAQEKPQVQHSATSGIGMRDKMGYAFADMGGVLSFGIVGAFLQMFYSDVLQIPMAQITILMLVSRIWDAVNDPLWGSIIDSRRPGKHGKFRPYLLWGAVPLAIATVLMFTKIPGLSQTQYLIYASVTYFAYDIFYTMVNIPVGSMASVITDDAIERTSLSTFRAIGGGLANLPGQVILPLFVYSVAAGTGVKYLDGSKLLTGVLVVAGFSLIIYFFGFRMTKERLPFPKEPPKINIGKTVAALLGNRAFIALGLTAMLLLACTMYSQSANNYLFKNYYQQPELFSIVSICTYAGMALMLPFVGKLVRRFGTKNLSAAGLVIATVASLVLWLARVQNPYVYVAGSFIIGLGVSVITMELWALAADVIDYHEYRTHKREEGTAYACFSFMRKMGQTVAGSGAALALAIVGYDVQMTMEILPDNVLDGMYTIATLVPAVLYLLMFLLMAFVYPLGKKQTSVLHARLTRRRSGEPEKTEGEVEI